MALLTRARAGVDLLRRELRDGAHAAVYVRQLLRGNYIRRDRRAHSNPAAPPVLLIHGFLATRGSLHLLERRLEERGHLVLSYRLGLANLGDIRRSAEHIARRVASIVAQTGVDRIDIVGHSMGGLVGLYYVKRLGGDAHVRRLVLLGTPAQGTLAAVLGLAVAPLGRASLQLLPGSPFLRDLGTDPLPPGVDVVAIAGERDWFAPLASTVLAGVRHVPVPAGHSGLLVDEAVADAVSEALGAGASGG